MHSPACWYCQTRRSGEHDAQLDLWGPVATPASVVVVPHTVYGVTAGRSYTPAGENCPEMVETPAQGGSAVTGDEGPGS